MHQVVFNEFERICRTRGARGRVLEVGATPDATSLLNLPALNDVSEKVGINMSGAGHYNDFSILEMNAHDMTHFPDRHFDVILCNAVFEHDPYFWRSLAEMRRVARPGSLMIIGTPGYGRGRHEGTIRSWLGNLPRWLRPKDGWALQHATLTLGLHHYPGDYYRFSEQAHREVLFEGMQHVEIRTLLNPPRIIGSGIVPAPST